MKRALKVLRADRAPTWTSKTVDALRRADDFLNMEQLLAATGATGDQMRAALHHLKVRAGAVDCLEAEGHLWWFLTGEDRRSKTVDERVPEPKGNRNRKKQGRPPKAE